MENRLKSSLPVPWRSQVRSLQTGRPCLVLEFDLALFWKPFLSLLSCQPPSVCALYIPSARLRGVLCWRISSRCSSWPQGGESARDRVMRWEFTLRGSRFPCLPLRMGGRGWAEGPHEFWEFSHKTTQTWTKCTGPTQSWCFSETVCQGFKEKKKKGKFTDIWSSRGEERTPIGNQWQCSDKFLGFLYEKMMSLLFILLKFDWKTSSLNAFHRPFSQMHG